MRLVNLIMIEDLFRNIKTLQNAIGNEPMSQILGNIWRKAIGLEPVLRANKIDYQAYCAQRAKQMRARSITDIQDMSFSIIWVVDSFDLEKLKSTYSSMQQQRLTTKEILLVCRQTTVAEQLSMDCLLYTSPSPRD